MPQDLFPDPDPGPDDAEPDGFPGEDAPGPEQGLYITLPPGAPDPVRLQPGRRLRHHGPMVVGGQ
jgi:hypothetical protein